MFHKFKITAESKEEIRSYSVSRNKEEILGDIESELATDEYYRVEYHKCKHDIPKPCKPWEVVAEKGEVPEAEE